MNTKDFKRESFTESDQTAERDVPLPPGETLVVPVSLPDHELHPLPALLDGPPFGAGRDGKPIRHITGAGLIAAIRHISFLASLNKKAAPVGWAALDVLSGLETRTAWP